MIRLLLSPLRFLLHCGVSDETRGLVIAPGYYTAERMQQIYVRDWRTGA